MRVSEPFNFLCECPSPSGVGFFEVNFMRVSEPVRRRILFEVNFMRRILQVIFMRVSVSEPVRRRILQVNYMQFTVTKLQHLRTPSERSGSGFGLGFVFSFFINNLIQKNFFAFWDREKPVNFTFYFLLFTRKESTIK